MANEEMMCCAYCSQLYFGVFHCNYRIKICYALDKKSTIAFNSVIQILNVLTPPGDSSGCL